MECLCNMVVNEEVCAMIDLGMFTQDAVYCKTVSYKVLYTCYVCHAYAVFIVKFALLMIMPFFI